MKSFFKKLTSAVLAVMTAVTALTATAFTAGTADTSKYPDSAAITAAMGAGWNLGNQLEACINGTPSETAWGNPVITEDTFKMIKAAGFKSVRIPVSYLSKIGSKASGYKIDAEWLNRVQEVVDYAIKQDLYVIINMHGDGYYSVDGGWLLCAESNQTEIKAKYKACWKQIAEKFKNYDDHLIFESMNEVFDGKNYNSSLQKAQKEAYDNINAYNQLFVDTVRATGSKNASRWLLVPGWNTDIDATVNQHGLVTKFGFELPKDTKCTASSNRLMVSVHFYAPYGFCLEEKSTVTQWGANGESGKKDSYGQEDAVETQFKKLYDKFTSQGIPVIVGEMGAVDKSMFDSKNTACREDWYEYTVSTAIKYGCIPVIWDNGWNGKYGFGLFNRSTYKVTQQSLIDAINSGVKNSKFIGYHVHSYTKTVVKPTYEAQGYTLYKCSCGESYKSNYKAKLTVPALTAKSSYTCTTTAVRINWNKVSSATGYKVFRYDPSSKKWVALKAIYDNTVLTYKDSGLKPGTVYKYRVKAFVKSNGKFYFGQSCSTITTATRPSTLKITRVNRTSSAVRLYWNKVNCTGYKLQRYDAASKTWKTVKYIPASTTNYRISNLKKNTTYKFRILAYRSDGSKNVPGAWTYKNVTTLK